MASFILKPGVKSVDAPETSAIHVLPAPTTSIFGLAVCVTSNPARNFGLNERGRVDRTLRADLILVSREDLTPAAVIGAGVVRRRNDI